MKTVSKQEMHNRTEKQSRCDENNTDKKKEKPIPQHWGKQNLLKAEAPPAKLSSE